jgi:hypothetical protein
VDHNDWHQDDYHLELLNNIGIQATGFWFDTGRDWWITPKDVRLVDSEKLCAACDIKHKAKLIQIADLYVYTSRNHRREKALIESCHLEHGRSFPRLDRAVVELKEHAQTVLDDTLHRILRSISDQYDYLTSAEAIIDTIRANGYEFDEHGNLA